MKNLLPVFSQIGIRLIIGVLLAGAFLFVESVHHVREHRFRGFPASNARMAAVTDDSEGSSTVVEKGPTLKQLDQAPQPGPMFAPAPMPKVSPSPSPKVTPPGLVPDGGKRGMVEGLATSPASSQRVVPTSPGLDPHDLPWTSPATSDPLVASAPPPKSYSPPPKDPRPASSSGSAAATAPGERSSAWSTVMERMRVATSPFRVTRPSFERSDEKQHSVKSGETLSSIAKRYQVSVSALMKANKLKDPNKITVGQKLVIPDK